jgi:hypothetical protein
MICFISYHLDDEPLMARWANHVQKLGGVKAHHIILLPAHGASYEKIKQTLSSAFGKVEVLPCHHTERGWPISCNMAFEQAAWHSYNVTKQPFLWMEPDAVPLDPSWLDAIEAEYQKCEKPFMGDFVKIAGVMPNGVDHMSGIAVYHWNMPRLSPSIFRNESVAWDIMSAREVVHQMHKTSLIQHDWIPEAKWRRDVVDSSCVKPGALVYHPDKKGVLFSDSESSPNGVQGDPATGRSSLPHETKEISDEEKPQVQYETPAKDQQALVIERFNSILISAGSDSKLKRQIKASLIDHGWIKAPKKGKRPRKKVSSPVGDV